MQAMDVLSTGNFATIHLADTEKKPTWKKIHQSDVFVDGSARKKPKLVEGVQHLLPVKFNKPMFRGTHAAPAKSKRERRTDWQTDKRQKDPYVAPATKILSTVAEDKQNAYQSETRAVIL